MIARAVLLALLLALCFAGPAAAVSQVAPAAPRIIGPQVDGDHVVWGINDLDEVRFRVLGPDGTVSNGADVAGAGQWGIAADGGEFAYWRQETFCPTDRCYGYDSLASAEVAVGAHQGPYSVLDHCPGSTRIPEICGTDSCFFAGTGIELSSRVLAHAEFCQPYKIVVRDLDTGEVRVHDLDLSAQATTVGRYLAVRQPESPDIVVSDPLTGEERFRVEQPTVAFALAPDGLLVMYDQETGELSWANEQDPSVHHIANIGTEFVGMRVRRGLVAFARYDPFFGSLGEVTVFDLAGRSVSAAVTRAVGDWDFDGRRVAWASAPCEIALVLVWDIHAGPPSLSNGDCPAARPLSASKRVRRKRMLRMRLRCPDQPLLGCRGAARLVARARTGRRRLIGTMNYGVLPGETDEGSTELSPETYRWLRRNGKVKVVARVFAVRREGQEAQERRKFKFVVRAK